MGCVFTAPEYGPDERQPFGPRSPKLPVRIKLSELGKYIGVRYFHLCLVTIGFMLSLVPAALIGAVPYIMKDIKEEFKVSDAKASLIISGVILGGVLGSPLLGWLCDAIGRKSCLALCAVAVVLLAPLHLFIPHGYGFEFLVLLRVLLGVPYAGLNTVITPYIMEFASDRSRGWITNVTHIAWPVANGICILLVALGDHDWRYDLAMCAVFAFVAGLSLIVVPESPRWLMVAGWPDEAERVLNRIFMSPGVGWIGCCGHVGVGPSPAIDTEASGLNTDSSVIHQPGTPRQALMIQQEGHAQLPLLFARKLRSTTCTTCFLMIITMGSQSAGWVWGPALLSHAASVEKIEIWVFLLAEATGLVGTLVAIFLLDCWGRKPLLVGSYAVTAVCVALLAMGAPLLGAILLWQVIGISHGVMWAAAMVYVCEVFPTQVRGTGVGVASLAGRLAAGGLPILFGALLDVSASVALWVLAGIMLVGAIGAALLMKETAGREMGDVGDGVAH